ncbi:hypothetical protein SAMN04488074_111224 [Lentzea albidocapillata subsp. violacea]|uniref:Sporulation related domain-containing protein n=1 Tax=Lentzea albidocapillata subsp. violacea TaxID=128104 RepID=A0A1G9KS94_9PSEU|nr:hypothetical protein [Lentzea albidocapillata]SDL52357.1 hypothetical protein SAMN04488074_111224 [Lentzea albidocapillata subsp. violacea]
MTGFYQTGIVFGVLGLLALVLRYFAGNDKRPVPDLDGTDFGLLSEVAVVPTEEAANVLVQKLKKNGVRATRSRNAPYRVMVFPADVANARLVLRS